jgi:hypothetical protein
MKPPPIGRFPDRDTLVESIRDFALSQGYGITLPVQRESDLGIASFLTFDIFDISHLWVDQMN